MNGTRLPVPVWDAPTRLFHWITAIAIAACYVTWRMGWMQWHFLCGYTVMALLLFRLAWGVVGSDTARFRRFLKSPWAALRHLVHFTRPEADDQIGHNAAGGWMVLVLLCLIAAQVATGLCANDQVISQGPLADTVGNDWSDRLSAWHDQLFYVLLAAVALHVLAVLAYALVKRHDLVRPMITGRKRLPAGSRAPRMASPVLALALLILAAAITWAVAAGLVTGGQ